MQGHRIVAQAVRLLLPPTSAQPVPIFGLSISAQAVPNSPNAGRTPEKTLAFVTRCWAKIPSAQETPFADRLPVDQSRWFPSRPAVVAKQSSDQCPNRAELTRG